MLLTAGALIAVFTNQHASIPCFSRLICRDSKTLTMPISAQICPVQVHPILAWSLRHLVNALKHPFMAYLNLSGKIVIGNNVMRPASTSSPTMLQDACFGCLNSVL